MLTPQRARLKINRAKSKMKFMQQQCTFTAAITLVHIAVTTYFCSCNCTCAYCSSNLLLQWQVQLCTLLIQFNFAATAPCSNNSLLQL